MLASGVNTPEASEPGRKVQEELRASFAEQTPARIKSAAMRRQAYVDDMIGLIFPDALAQGAFEHLSVKVADSEAA